MKVGIVGAGAVGAYVASRLFGNCELSLIVDGERYERYRRNPLSVGGVKYDFDLVTPEMGRRMDLVIFATKNFQLEEAMETASPFISDGTTIISLLNGITSEEVLSERFGSEKVLYAMIRISSIHSGNEIRPMNQGTIVFGEKDNAVSERVKEISALFERSGILYTVPRDSRHEVWWKFMLNCCVNAVSSVMDCTFHEMHDNSELHKAFFMIGREVQAVAAREGVVITEDDVLDLKRKLNDTNGKTSLLQDVLAGRRTENEYFCGAVSALGRKHGIPTPCCDFLSKLVDASSHVHRLRLENGSTN